MTRTQRALVDAMNAAVREGRWEAINRRTIRFAETVETPRYHYGTGPGEWRHSTYTRHVWLEVVTGQPWSIFLRVDHGPWVTARDSKVSFKRAFEIIANPGVAFS
jgi:hypothetical protein